MVEEEGPLRKEGEMVEEMELEKLVGTGEVKEVAMGVEKAVGKTVGDGDEGGRASDYGRVEVLATAVVALASAAAVVELATSAAAVVGGRAMGVEVR